MSVSESTVLRVVPIQLELQEADLGVVIADLDATLQTY